MARRGREGELRGGGNRADPVIIKIGGQAMYKKSRATFSFKLSYNTIHFTHKPIALFSKNYRW